MVAVVFWLVLIVFCVAAEIHTNAFVALFVGLGAILGFLLALLHVPFVLQALAWLGLSALTLWLLRPLLVHRMQRGEHQLDMSQPTLSALTNLRGIVESTVGDEHHPGRVKIQGESWKAVTEWPEAIAGGTPIVVRKALGTVLWVDPV